MKQHHCIQIQTNRGLQAKIRGRRNMRPETREALAELIDAATKMEGSEIEDCEICGANPKTGNPKHDPDCPNNPETLEEFESL
jgi:hypothetical protein